VGRYDVRKAFYPLVMLCLLYLLFVVFSCTSGSTHKLADLSIERIVVRTKIVTVQNTVTSLLTHIKTSDLGPDWNTRLRIGLYFPSISVQDWRTQLLNSENSKLAETERLLSGISMKVTDIGTNQVFAEEVATKENRNYPDVFFAAPFLDLSPIPFVANSASEIGILIDVPNMKKLLSLFPEGEFVVGIKELPLP